GLVIKSHGSADAIAFESALKRGFEQARHRVLDRTVAEMRPFVAQLAQLEQASRGIQPAAAGA
ncbi:MAG TPA: phosphate acyltransferase, partial [Burkholderiaceae bacterium]|nr:phosphate acyltransferase [Burkholderiaceae bacterium]